MMHALAGLLAAVLLQGRWQQVGLTSTGNPVFVDSKTVKRAKDGIISATVRVVYAKPVAIPGKGEVNGSKAVAMFNCTANSLAESWVKLPEICPSPPVMAP